MRWLLFILVLYPLTAAARDLPQPVRAALARAGVPLSAASVVVEPAIDGPVLIAHQA
jgi:hypothetical protein